MARTFHSEFHTRNLRTGLLDTFHSITADFVWRIRNYQKIITAAQNRRETRVDLAQFIF